MSHAMHLFCGVNSLIKFMQCVLHYVKRQYLDRINQNSIRLPNFFSSICRLDVNKNSERSQIWSICLCKMTVVKTKCVEQAWDIKFLVHIYSLCEDFVTVKTPIRESQNYFIFITSVTPTEDFSSLIISQKALHCFCLRIKDSLTLKSKYQLFCVITLFQ